MIVQQFIDLKTKQLSFYIREFFNQKLPYSELNMFVWDTLEEWTQVKIQQDEPYSSNERVFWHLVYLLNYWPENQLQKDFYLKEELELCIRFLEGEGFYPMDCIGIRP